MWEINNELQLLGFLRSVALGGLLCVFYDFLKAYRIAAKPSAVSVMVQDILYFCLCAPITFCFLLSVTNGEIRGFVFVGAVFGFILLRLTISGILVKILVFVFKGGLKISAVFNRGIYNICVLIYRLFDKIMLLLVKNLKKAANCLKKVLKKR